MTNIYFVKGNVARSRYLHAFIIIVRAGRDCGLIDGNDVKSAGEENNNKNKLHIPANVILEGTCS